MALSRSAFLRFRSASSIRSVGVMPVDREKESFSASPPLCLCHPMSMTARSRSLHSTAAPQSATFAVACLGIAGACYTLDHGVKSFQQWQEQRAASGGDAEAGGGTEGGESAERACRVW